MKQTLTSTPGVPDAFVSKFGRQVTGFLCGFDRLRFHASLRMRYQPVVMGLYLSRQKVLLKDFKDDALRIMERVKEAAYHSIAVAGRRNTWPARARRRKLWRVRHRATRQLLCAGERPGARPGPAGAATEDRVAEGRNSWLLVCIRGVQFGRSALRRLGEGHRPSKLAVCMLHSQRAGVGVAGLLGFPCLLQLSGSKSGIRAEKAILR